jgi:hypothetical protein
MENRGQVIVHNSEPNENPGLPNQRESPAATLFDAGGEGSHGVVIVRRGISPWLLEKFTAATFDSGIR